MPLFLRPTSLPRPPALAPTRCLPSRAPGLSLLPLTYAVAFRFRVSYFYFWLLPALCALLWVLEAGWPSALQLDLMSRACLPMVRPHACARRRTHKHAHALSLPLGSTHRTRTITAHTHIITAHTHIHMHTHAAHQVLAVAAHYLAVYYAVRLRMTSRDALDAFADGVSAYLVDSSCAACVLVRERLIVCCCVCVYVYVYVSVYV